MPTIPSSTYVEGRYSEIAVALMAPQDQGGYGIPRAELIEGYALSDDATDSDIGLQAVLHGDANSDGSLN